VSKTNSARILAYLVCSLLLAMALPAHAGAGIIGMALSNTGMQVDQATVSGNVNLNDGAILTTSSSPTRIRLTNGARAVLSPYSSAAVFSDRLVLQKGTGTVSSLNYQLQSQGLQIAAASPDSQAQVTVQDATVHVEALRGNVKITGANGIVLARVVPGSALDITPGAANSSVSTMSGVLRNQDGRFLLHDKLTHLDVELNGISLDSEVGRRIEVTGTAQPSRDRQSQLIQVARLNRLDNSPEPTPKPAPVPAPKPGGVPGGAPSAAIANGLSLGARIGIAAAIGGAAIGATTYAVMSR
jgi:hypothetical protein